MQRIPQLNEGETTLLALLNVQHAYNGVNLHKLAILLWERGVRGKVWMLTIRMILGLVYRVRVNGARQEA